MGTVAVAILAAVVAESNAMSAQDRTSQAQSLADRREQARVAGCDFAKALNVYDYRHIDDYQRLVRDSATGSYKAALVRAESGQKAGVVASQSRSEVTAVHCGLASLQGDQAEVVLSSTVAVTDRVGAHPQPDRFAAVATLRQVDGHWLTESLDVSQAPPAPTPPPPPPPAAPLPPPPGAAIPPAPPAPAH